MNRIPPLNDFVSHTKLSMKHLDSDDEAIHQFHCLIMDGNDEGCIDLFKKTRAREAQATTLVLEILGRDLAPLLIDYKGRSEQALISNFLPYHYKEQQGDHCAVSISTRMLLSTSDYKNSNRQRIHKFILNQETNFHTICKYFSKLMLPVANPSPQLNIMHHDFISSLLDKEGVTILKIESFRVYYGLVWSPGNQINGKVNTIKVLLEHYQKDFPPSAFKNPQKIGRAMFIFHGLKSVKSKDLTLGDQKTLQWIIDNMPNINDLLYIENAREILSERRTTFINFLKKFPPKGADTSLHSE